MRRADQMPLSELRIGRVVTRSNDLNGDDFGHIVGFSRNSTDELILVVQWSRSRTELNSTTPIHMANVWIVE